MILAGLVEYFVKSFAAGNTGTIQHVTNEPTAESSRSWLTQRSSEQLVLRGHNSVFPRYIGMRAITNVSGGVSLLGDRRRRYIVTREREGEKESVVVRE